MRIKAFLASLLTLILHLAAPLDFQATSPAPGDVFAIATPWSDDGGACVPRASAYEDLCRPSVGHDQRDLLARQTSSRRPFSALSVQLARGRTALHRTSYPPRRTLAHCRPHPDDDRPA
jgi:hypothetical protein